MSTIEKLIDWFLFSPIYEDGGYLAFYSANRKGPIYQEITAYAISLSCILYSRKEDARFLKRAETCAKYMMAINKNGGVPCFSDNLLFAFDTGVFISSMFDLYSVNNKEVYLNEAEKSLNWLYSLWDRKPFVAVDKIPENKDWYHAQSVHLTKLVLPLIKASIYLKDEKYERTALELLDKYKKLQTEKGCFKVCEGSEVVMTHPHCYATEGFLFAYHTLKKQEFLEIAEKSSDWLGRMQNSDGSLCRSYDIEKTARHKQRQEKMKTADATAQATRIWKLLGVNQEGIEKAYEYLNSELKDNGLRLYKNETLTGKLFSGRRAVYSWPTFFYLHSLILPFGQIQYCNELF